jgi:cytochrome P450
LTSSSSSSSSAGAERDERRSGELVCQVLEALPSLPAGVGEPADRVHQSTRGVPLWVAFGAANRDPRVFDDPHSLLLGRPDVREQLTFGHGRHVCLGATLARTQITLAMTAVARAFPELRLLGEPTEVPIHVQRITPSLPVSRT